MPPRLLPILGNWWVARAPRFATVRSFGSLCHAVNVHLNCYRRWGAQASMGTEASPPRWELARRAGIAADGQEKRIVGMTTHDADSDNPSDLGDSPTQTAQAELDAYGVPVQERR